MSAISYHIQCICALRTSISFVMAKIDEHTQFFCIWWNKNWSECKRNTCKETAHSRGNEPNRHDSIWQLRMIIHLCMFMCTFHHFFFFIMSIFICLNEKCVWFGQSSRANVANLALSWKYSLSPVSKLLLKALLGILSWYCEVWRQVIIKAFIIFIL